jgi:hypothetical protein
MRHQRQVRLLAKRRVRRLTVAGGACLSLLLFGCAGSDDSLETAGSPSTEGVPRPSSVVDDDVTTDLPIPAKDHETLYASSGAALEAFSCGGGLARQYIGEVVLSTDETEGEAVDLPALTVTLLERQGLDVAASDLRIVAPWTDGRYWLGRQVQEADGSPSLDLVVSVGFDAIRGDLVAEQWRSCEAPR